MLAFCGRKVTGKTNAALKTSATRRFIGRIAELI
jgi:hypothetical protein